MSSQSLPKSLAMVLATAFARAASAREAVEHRLTTLRTQEKLVENWTNDPVGMAAKNYPRQELSSYPVQTRIAGEESTLRRYRAELPERLSLYAHSLSHMASVEAEVEKLASSGSFTGPLVPRPLPSPTLSKSTWPRSWPLQRVEAEAVRARKHMPTIAHGVVLTCREPDPAEFALTVGAHEVLLTARFADGISEFVGEFQMFMDNDSSSRWRAITEAVRCDIRWPKLEDYLASTPSPWLPRNYVDETFGLRGSLARREDLADHLNQLSADAARWYLSRQPGRVGAASIDLTMTELGELKSAGLIRLGVDMDVEALLQAVPFAEVKCLFILAGLAPPKSFAHAVSRFEDVRAIRDEAYMQAWLGDFVDSSEYLEVLEVPSITRDERLGPRARANVMVSSLVQLGDGDPGAEAILE